MPKVPGQFDGSRYEDLRILLPKPIREHYEKRGLWDDIVLVAFYEHSDVVWLHRVHGPSYCKHKWGYRGSKRVIVGDDFQDAPPRGAVK